MDLREYDHITSSPDTFPRSTLLSIKKVLHDIDSPNAVLIDKVIANGYVVPPKEYQWHGCYRVILDSDEKLCVLNDLFRAKEELKGHARYLGVEIEYVSQYAGYWARLINEAPIPYEEAIKTQRYYDLRNASLDSFTAFIFEHEVPEDKENDDVWYYDSNMWIDFNKEKLIGLYIQLFSNSEILPDLFTDAQLEQGCWAMLGPNLEVGLENIIWDRENPIEMRVRLIKSMYDLYNNLYKQNQLDTSCNMWWDALAYNFYPGGSRTREETDDRKIQDAMFATLSNILDIDAHHCQIAALHGLGHLRHPDTEQVIMRYLDKYPDLDKKDRDYAMACIRGDVM